MSEKVLLLARLAERFLPAMDAVLRPVCKKGVAALMGLVTQRAPEIRELVASIEDGSAPNARIKAFAACGVGLRPLNIVTLTKKVNWSIDDAIEAATFTLVLGWLDLFRKPEKGTLVIDTDGLDASMLPPLDLVQADRFRECCRRVCLTEAEARGILCAVRGALPPGDAFPTEAAKLLDADVITIIC